MGDLSGLTRLDLENNLLTTLPESLGVSPISMGSTCGTTS
ncbi:hypothetical protein [Streptosporangium fragile]